MLQALSILPSLWNRVPSKSSSLSPLLKSITQNMKIKSRSNKPVDPSSFLWALTRKISASRQAPFYFNSPEDATKVLQFVIDKLKGTSVAASDFISNIIRINVSCNQCFSFSAKEETLDMLTIPLSPNINSSLFKFLKPETLESKNKWFCPSCSCLIDKCSHNYVKMKYFSLSKNSLMALVNHSGTMDQGHYWAVIKDLNSGGSLTCNDKVVLAVSQHSLNNSTSYILFHKRN